MEHMVKITSGGGGGVKSPSFLVYDPEFELTVRCTMESRLLIFSEKGGQIVYDLNVSPIVFTYAVIVKVDFTLTCDMTSD